MAKVMTKVDVLRCLARNVIYRPVASGKYECDTSCNGHCVEFKMLPFCLAVRNLIDRYEVKGY
jgi:hypothetical protein